jgi:hypothetical protein
MANTDTLNPEQIKSWRKIIAMRLEKISPGSGLYAIIMPESEVIEYWRKMKKILELSNKQQIIKTKCNHSNSIIGQNGKYCIDCEKYID